ncbi:aspartyl/asparaginyl beta-hydroxylase domain-containing protein [Pseudomonas sp. LS_1]|uniref:aspartyl/asparaginyl beta-hydroxylase domain-containing protein n=1 Tax=Pseudomonas sp. LS_1 TaxID=3055788 RepID=UPI0035BFDE8A
MPDLPRCSRLPLAIDLADLLQALARLDAEAWQAHFNRDYHEGDWSGVSLVAAEDAPLPLAPGLGAPVHSAWWRDEPAWQALLQRWPAKVRAARLLRLGPGARIHEHRDPDLGSPGGCLRLHVPLLSPEGVAFLVDGLQVPMRPGECWFLDLSRPHRVNNPSARERVHLVIDCEADPALLALIDQGLAQTLALQLGRAGRDFAHFRECVVADPALARRLQALGEPQAFIAQVLRECQRLGLEFSEAEVRGAMRQGKQAWSDQWRV